MCFGANFRRWYKRCSWNAKRYHFLQDSPSANINMKCIVVCVVLSIVYAFVESVPAPQYGEVDEKGYKKHIPILKNNFEQHHEGYQFSYDTGNGIHAEETAYIKNKGDKEHETIVKKGTITYLDEHGHPYSLSYIADEDGFHPQGDHLPTQPPAAAPHGHEPHPLPYHREQEYEQYQKK